MLPLAAQLLLLRASDDAVSRWSHVSCCCCMEPRCLQARCLSQPCRATAVPASSGPSGAGGGRGRQVWLVLPEWAAAPGPQVRWESSSHHADHELHLPSRFADVLFAPPCAVRQCLHHIKQSQAAPWCEPSLVYHCLKYTGRSRGPSTLTWIRWLPGTTCAGPVAVEPVPLFRAFLQLCGRPQPSDTPDRGAACGGGGRHQQAAAAIAAPAVGSWARPACTTTSTSMRR